MAEGSWLEKKLVVLNALYQRFGRDGLRGQPIADVRLLLSAKELQLRDVAGGPNLGEERKAANHTLELEIKDLKAYVQGRADGLSLAALRSSQQKERSRPQEQQRQVGLNGRDMDLER